VANEFAIDDRVCGALGAKHEHLQVLTEADSAVKPIRYAPVSPPATFRNSGSGHGFLGKRAIRQASARLTFPPPYSPDLNPFEQVFAELKTFVRKAAERSVEDTWRRIVQLLDHFFAAECAKDLVNSGYAPN
jgi:hypothetical protein